MIERGNLLVFTITQAVSLVLESYDASSFGEIDVTEPVQLICRGVAARFGGTNMTCTYRRTAVLYSQSDRKRLRYNQATRIRPLFADG